MGSIENEIIQIVISRLQRERERSMILNSLGSYMNTLTKKNKKYIKRVGFEKFIHNHPDKFAIIDERVFLLEDRDIPSNLANGDVSISPPQPVVELNHPKPPADLAMDSIIKELKKSPSCMVCSEDIEIFAYGVCFHAICFKCCTKLRVLCLDKQCPVCRAELTKVIFTVNLKKFNTSDLSNLNKEPKYGIYFDSRKIQNSYKQLLEHPCTQCNSIFEEFDRLEKHLKEKHREYFCQICIKQCKKFTSERKSYSSSELEDHQSEGDNGEGSAHKGHPLCQFCDQRYLDRDELYRHLRMNHITCKLCEDADNIFYVDVQGLWEHIMEKHFACDAEDCQLNLNSAFKNEVDLQAHRVKSHPNMSNKFVRKQEQQLQIPGMFDRQHSRGFEFTSPQKDAPIIYQPDGSILCDGTVLGQHLKWNYGFIEPDGDDLSFNDNIFFNQQACDLDFDEHLSSHFSHGERVRVRAQRADHQRSKWRAITVEKITAATAPLRIQRTYTTSESSDISSASLQREDHFPALDSVATPLPVTTSWNNLQKHVKLKVSYKPSASTSSLSPRVETNISKHGACPETGFGVVHHNLRNEFGFIVWKGAKDFCDNIYFHRMAYVEGLEGNGHCSNLLTDKTLRIGVKVEYKLDPRKPHANGVKSKYRAQWIKVVEQSADKKNETPQTSSTNVPNDPPIGGNGKISQVSDAFGFIVWEGRESIYFNKGAYLKGRTDMDFESFNLTSELKIGTEVRFIFDRREVGADVSAKYRAQRVWRYDESNVPQGQESRKISQASSSGSVSDRKDNTASPAPPTDKLRKKVSVEELFQSTSTTRQPPDENVPTDQLIVAQRDALNQPVQNGSFYSEDFLLLGSNSSDERDFVYNSSDEEYYKFNASNDESVNGGNGDISGFEELDYSHHNGIAAEDQHSKDALKSFCDILTDISGKYATQVTAFLTTSLKIGHSCLFVEFSRRGKTQIFLSPPDGAGTNVDPIMNVDCGCSGFDENVVGGLIMRGVLSCAVQDVMNVTGSSHYVLLHRNAKGAVESLTVHYTK